MIESLKIWARFNLATDQKVHALIRGLGEGAYTEDRNTYFRSLAALHWHYVQTYRLYFSIIRKNWGNRYFLSPVTEEKYEVKASPSLDEVTALAVECGQLLVDFLEVVDPADLVGPKTPRTLRSGKSHLLAIGDFLTQMINHTAHHRGQLSQILDELGVEHDIGGILGFSEEAKE